jgi:uncharacterized protein (TIGR03435 family)
VKARLDSAVRRIAVAVSLTTALCITLGAQTDPSFEVASIKVDKSGGIAPEKERFLPGERIELFNATLKEMIVPTYGVQRDMVIGGPKWIDTIRYDIVAKAAPDTPVPALLGMLRTLLAERFKLTFHHEDKVVPAYALVVKDESKLHATSGGGRQSCNSRPVQADGQVLLHRECHNITMAEFVRQLGLGGYGLDRPVVDLTKLTGSYDFGFDYSRREMHPQDANATPSADLPGPSIFDALPSIGLKLEAGKHPVPVIVIDNAAQPEEN